MDKETEEKKRKIMEKIRRAREEWGDNWFKEHYLKELESLSPLKNKFGVSELKEKEIEGLEEELKRFKPYACKNCGYDAEIPRRIFKIEKVPRRLREWKELKKYMKKKYNVSYFKVREGLLTTTLNVGICPRCESQYVMFDYRLFIRRPKGWR